MSAARVAFAAALVTAAWATAITGIALVGAAKAEAAWQTSGPGAAAAKADALPVPTATHLTDSNCNNGNPKASLAWTNPAAGSWTGLDVVAAPSATSTDFTVLTTTTGTSAANLLLPYKPAFLSVRTVRNNWRGRSAAVSAC